MKQLILLFAFLTSFSMQSFGQIPQSADSDTLNGTTVVSTIDDPDDYWTEEKQLSKGGEFLFNQMEVEIDIHKLHERRIDQHLDDIGGNDGVRLVGDDFFVFFKDVIGNTKDVLSFVQSSPYREIISSP